MHDLFDNIQQIRWITPIIMIRLFSRIGFRIRKQTDQRRILGKKLFLIPVINQN